MSRGADGGTGLSPDVPIFGTVVGEPPDGRCDAGPDRDFLIGVADAAASRQSPAARGESPSRALGDA